jgi:hypothetical protein
MEATSQVTDAAPASQVIAAWASSGIRARQIAAAWGQELLSTPRHARVESSMKIAERFHADNSMAVRARNLLMGAKIIYKSDDDNRYHVA